jgi:hypothetical protein
VKHTFDWTEACRACKATGIYIGFAEKNGAGVVCSDCKGTGELMHHVEWEDFEGKRRCEGVQKVYPYNPGVCLRPDTGKGGMDYDEWFAGMPFPRGSEPRSQSCPAWYYQGADYMKKPVWKECGYGSFLACQHFGTKEQCWARWDRENPEEVSK